MNVATGCHTHGQHFCTQYCIMYFKNFRRWHVPFRLCTTLLLFMWHVRLKCQFLKGVDRHKLSRCVARMPLKSSMVPVQEWSVSYTCIWRLAFITSQNMEIPSHIYGNEMIRSVNFTSIGQLYPSDHHTLKWRHSLAVLIDPCLRPMWRSFPTIHPSVNLRRF